MRITRFKGIAEYITAKLGYEVTVTQCRKWSHREGDPLPLDCFAGSTGADSDELDAWIERQKGVRKKHPKRVEAQDREQSGEKEQLALL